MRRRSDWVIGIGFWLAVTIAALYLGDLYPGPSPWVYRTMTPIVAIAGMAVYSVVLIVGVVSGIRRRRGRSAL